MELLETPDHFIEGEDPDPRPPFYPQSSSHPGLDSLLAKYNYYCDLTVGYNLHIESQLKQN